MEIISKKRILSVTVVLFFALTITCPLVFALDLQTAKQQGLVGETISGYLKPVKPTPEVEKLVRDINSKRKEQYLRIANRRGVNLSAVEQIAGEKAIAKTPPGQYVKINGKWVKK